MKNKAVFFTELIFLWLLIESCNNNSDKPDFPPSFRNKVEFIKIIPKTNNDNLNFSFWMSQDYTRQTKLNIIENGFDSLFIRLWYSYNANMQVVDFKKERGIWSAEFHSMQRIKERIEDTLKVLRINSVKMRPKSGWDFFIKKFLSLGILTLPDITDLPKLNIPSDAPFVIVELATTQKYRIYTYIMPMLFPEIKEAKSMEDIMILIEEEFGVKRLEKF